MQTSEKLHVRHYIQHADHASDVPFPPSRPAAGIVGIPGTKDDTQWERLFGGTSRASQCFFLGDHLGEILAVGIGYLVLQSDIPRTVDMMILRRHLPVRMRLCFLSRKKIARSQHLLKDGLASRVGAWAR